MSKSTIKTSNGHRLQTRHHQRSNSQNMAQTVPTELRISTDVASPAGFEDSIQSEEYSVISDSAGKRDDPDCYLSKEFRSLISHGNK